MRNSNVGFLRINAHNLLIKIANNSSSVNDDYSDDADNNNNNHNNSN